MVGIFLTVSSSCRSSFLVETPLLKIAHLQLKLVARLWFAVVSNRAGLPQYLGRRAGLGKGIIQDAFHSPC